MKRSIQNALIFLIVILCVALYTACSELMTHGMTTEEDVSAFVHDNFAVIKSGDPAQILALSDDISSKSTDEYVAFVCGTSGIGPDGTYYGFYYSVDGASKTMQGCNEYHTVHIKENIYYYEYIVY